MFCPNCGTENSKGQKFCTRCGTNLLAIDRAREIILEMNSSAPAPAVSPNLVFGATVLLSIIGFIAITTGTIELFNRGGGNNGPIPIIFPMISFPALVLICRFFLGLLRPGIKPEGKQAQPVPQNYYSQPPMPQHGTTNRALNEASVPYQSIVEDPTRQFERENS